MNKRVLKNKARTVGVKTVTWIMVIVFILCLCAADRSDLRVVAGLMIVSGGWLCAAHAKVRCDDDNMH